MSKIVDDLLKEAEEELMKTANDEQGAPETANTSSNGQGDIISTANSFLQKLEQFKGSLGNQTAEAGGGVDPNAADPGQNSPEVDQNGQPVNANPSGGGGATIQTPGGTIIKLASLIKIAGRNTKSIFTEVK